MRRPQRLSGLDAGFLYLETANQPLQMCMVIELDASTIPGGYSYDRFREELAARIKGIPAFREELSDTFLNLDHPAWAEDRNFDVDRHVHRVGLRAPGVQRSWPRSVVSWPVCRSIVARPCGRCG